ncbi:MAG: carbonic anhydrase [Bacteroidia bacterium]|jgi:carbonic anhydrase|nr:carbonic anhydrase [Bacteroidia bacterium]MCO5253012.1 carbonic anhydrase family protein [Bacteroidota bacterium]MCZ2131144.1 carbonic anhydrase [Bacteroidia bacterium]
MRLHSTKDQNTMTPQDAIEILKEGNLRFMRNLKTNNDLLEQVNASKEGQFPFACILSCIDSRTSAELIFDQGLGDIFSIRIAGNVVNDDILGSMEFGAKLANAKVVVVLGHTNCGGIKGACDNVELGNLTGLVNKIKPAITQETTIQENRNSSNLDFVNKVSVLNVFHVIREVRRRSPILNELEQQGKIMICGAMYDVSTGEVTFYEN